MCESIRTSEKNSNRNFPLVPHPSLHALLEDRVPPGLADDQVGPLDDDDADEEGCVAGELYDLPLFVGLQGRWNNLSVLLK